MSDELIIIDSYPNTIEGEDILDNCVNQLKKINKDILLVTHYPVKRETQQLVDYFIYDKNNPLLDESMLYWYGNDNFYLQTSAFGLGSASFAILLSIQNAVCLAKHLGKKMFYFFEYDCLISDKDLQNIDLIKNEVYKRGKMGHIQIDTHGVDIKNKGVCTIFFMFEVDFFLKNFAILANCEEYKKFIKNGITLEFYFYQILSKNFSQLYIKEKSFLKEIFPNSRLNISTNQSSHFIDVLPEKKSRKPILTITNPKSDVRDYKILFLKNDNNINEVEVSMMLNGYYYNYIPQEVKNIKVFNKKNSNYQLVYNKNPIIEVKNKKDFEYVRIK